MMMLMMMMKGQERKKEGKGKKWKRREGIAPRGSSSK